MKPVAPAMLALVACLAPVAARAQDASQGGDLTTLSLEQLMQVEVDRVYGASKFLQEVTRAPASITVIKSREIEEFGYQTLADLLRSVRGFYVAYDRNYSYVGTRGFARPGDYNSRILLLIDGHRVNDNVYDSAMLGTEFPLDFALIDHVEVIRGPGSSLYGTSAFFAVVNVVTKAAGTVDGLEVEVGAASLKTARARVTYGRKLDNGVGIVLSGSGYDSRQEQHLYYPQFDSPQTNNGYADNADRDRYANAFANVALGGLTVQAAYSARKKQIPTASYGTVFDDPGNFSLDARGYVDAMYGRQLGPATRLLARLFYDHYDYAGDYVYDLDEGRNVEKDFSRGDWLGTEVMLTRALGARQTLSGGFEFRENLVQKQWTYLADPHVDLVNDSRTSQNWGLYAQDEVRLHKKLTVSLGVRHDHYSEVGGSTNGRFGVIYNPAPATTLKLLHGSAFRAPSAFELFYNADMRGGALAPETVSTDEAVWEQYFGSHVRTAVSAFRYRVDGLISQQQMEEGDLLGPVYANLDAVRAAGAELEVEGTWKFLRARVSQTIERATDNHTGVTLTNMPRQLTKVNVRVPVAGNRFVIGYEGQYTSDRWTLARNVVPGHYIQNVSVTARRVASGLSVSAGLGNFANTRYADPGGEELVQDSIDQNGRTAWLKVAWKFRR